MAEQRIAVEVDHTRYATFANPGDREQRSIELTTIEPNQKRAVVRLFLFRGESRRLLTSFDLQELPRGGEKPLITLAAQRGRGSRMRFRIYVNNRLTGDQTVRVPRDKKPLLVAALAAAALALLLWGGLGLARSVFAPSVAEAPERDAPAEEPEEEEAAEPAGPSPAAEAPERDAPADEPEIALEVEDERETQIAAEEDETPEEPEAPEPPVSPAIEPQERTVYFTADSARITSETRAALRALAEELNEFLRDGAEMEVLRLHGHTAIAGPERGRLRLSEQRAENVHDVLVSLELPVAEHELEELDIRGYGSGSPVTHDPEKQHRNRRVEITVE